MFKLEINILKLAVLPAAVYFQRRKGDSKFNYYKIDKRLDLRGNKNGQKTKM